MQLEAPATDLAMWLPILAELLRGLRSWRFVDGVLLNPYGRPCKGVALITGAHPQPGARYRLTDLPTARADVTTEQVGPAPDRASERDELIELVRWRRQDGFAGVERWVARNAAVEADTPIVTSGELVGEPDGGVVASAPPVTEPELELLQDDRAAVRCALHFVSNGADRSVEVALLRPDSPQALQMTGSLDVGQQGWFGGPLTMSGRLHLDGLLGQQAREPQLQADVVHRRGSARLTARVTPAPDGRWAIAAELRVTGRGLLRAPIAVAGPFIERRFRREIAGVRTELQHSLQELDDTTGETLRAAFGPVPLPAEVADTCLDVVLAMLRRPEHGEQEGTGPR